MSGPTTPLRHTTSRQHAQTTPPDGPVPEAPTQIPQEMPGSEPPTGAPPPQENPVPFREPVTVFPTEA
jgi:hypothetical protein